MGNALVLQGHLHTMPWSLGTQHHREGAFHFLPTQQPGNIVSCTILASILINKLRLLPREVHSPGKLILTSKVRLKEEEGQRLSSKIQVQATVIIICRPQRPQHQLASALSSPTLHLFIPAEYQAFHVYLRYRSVSEYRFQQVLLSKILFINT